MRPWMGRPAPVLLCLAAGGLPLLFLATRSEPGAPAEPTEALAEVDMWGPDDCVPSESDGLGWVLICGSVRQAEALLEARPPLDERPADPWAPLHYAALAGRSDMVAFLLDHGADANAETGHGTTPLHLAAARQVVSGVPPDHAAVVQLLLAYGADPFALTREGFTALDRAKENDHTAAIKMLVSAMRELRARSGPGVGPEAPPDVACDTAPPPATGHGSPTGLPEVGVPLPTRSPVTRSS